MRISSTSRGFASGRMSLSKVVSFNTPGIFGYAAEDRVVKHINVCHWSHS